MLSVGRRVFYKPAASGIESCGQHKEPRKISIIKDCFIRAAIECGLGSGKFAVERCGLAFCHLAVTNGRARTPANH
jgi:hypothetical protein